MAIAYTLYYAGVLHAWQALALRRKAVVLMYHRVLTAEQVQQTASHPGIVVTRGTFARHMALLKRRFVVISVAELASRIERRIPFESSSCAITFDDGWLDTLTNGLPILEEHRLPAVVYLPVNFIGRRRMFWREALTHVAVLAILATRRDPATRRPLEEHLATAGLGHVLDIAAPDPRPAVIEAIAAQEQLRAAGAEALTASLARDLGVGLEELDTPDVFMNLSQLATMGRSGVTFGGHGADHQRLAELPVSTAREEIVASKEFLDRHFGEDVPTFSYPNGSWNAEVARAVEASGYRLAFTTDRGFVSCDDSPFTLRRVNIHEDATASPPMFMARLVGLF